MHVDARDRRRDVRTGVQRQSDNVYYKLFVVPEFSYVPEPEEFAWGWGIGFAILAVLFGLWLFISGYGDRKVHERRPAAVRRLRAGRKRAEQQVPDAARMLGLVLSGAESEA